MVRFTDWLDFAFYAPYSILKHIWIQVLLLFAMFGAGTWIFIELSGIGSVDLLSRFGLNDYNNRHLRTEYTGHAIPTNIWIEDAGGNKQGSITFTNGLFVYSAVKLGGSKMFYATFLGGA